MESAVPYVIGGVIGHRVQRPQFLRDLFKGLAHVHMQRVEVHSPGFGREMVQRRDPLARMRSQLSLRPLGVTDCVDQRVGILRCADGIKQVVGTCILLAVGEENERTPVSRGTGKFCCTL